MQPNQIGRWLRLAPVLLLGLWGQEAKLAEEGQRRMAAGDFAGAAGIYEQLVKQAPANPGWKLNLGIALHMAGRDKEAIEPLDVASKAIPQAFPAHAFLGTSLLRLGQAARAVAPLQRAVAMKPNDSQGRRLLAEAFLQTGQPKNAVGQLEALTRLEPNDAGAWFVLGRANESASAEAFQSLAKQFPESRGFLLTTAEVRRKQQRFKAADALEAQAKGRPPMARADALAKEIATFQAGALRAFSQLGKLPDNPQLHRVKAETLRAQGKHLEAVEEWRVALRFRPDDREVERELAASLYAGAQYLEALNTIERLLVHEPDSAILHFLKGDCLLQQGQAEEAIGSLRRAVSVLPARASLGRALLAVGRGAEAVPHLEASASALDTDGALYFQLSRAYQAVGETAKAAAALAESQKRRTEAQQ
ncbi:MAG: tetratricopeptide repeat protein [Acidobacteria bacterium]|nr:tetratricopeptide repeat protein [Acidobacteriota bacterium]